MAEWPDVSKEGRPSVYRNESLPFGVKVISL